MLTIILLEVTNEEMRNIAEETFSRARMKGTDGIWSAFVIDTPVLSFSHGVKLKWFSHQGDCFANGWW